MIIVSGCKTIDYLVSAVHGLPLQAVLQCTTSLQSAVK